ncbi:MAG: HAMP domain-containing sensor histidine kinase [Elainellaceae cyanobacterium]
MFQATRRRLAFWYTAVTAILLLLFATGFYLYVRYTLIERIDDTLNHVVEVVQRSLIIESLNADHDANDASEAQLYVNLEASFPRHADAVEDDHIDLEWFSPTGELLWSTFSESLNLPLHESDGETVYGQFLEQFLEKGADASLPDLSYALAAHSFALRQVTKRVQLDQQILGYLRVSHPWFEVTKPSRRLIRDLSLGTVITVGAVAGIGWFLSGLAIAPVRDSYQRLKQFTADASHELRNPIAVIQTNVQVALADPDPHLQQDQLRVVERLTRRLGRLVDDLLFLARQDSGITPLKWSTVHLDELLQEVVEEQQAIATEKALVLSLQIASPASLYASESNHEDFYCLQADHDQLIRLFTNLISNAVQYTPAQGHVEVTLKRIKQQGTTQLQVQVQDTGIGIATESLPHIFDRFYRADPARTSVGAQGKVRPDHAPGSGLGLAIAKVIADNYQGHISVESALNQGTTFTVTFSCLRLEAAKSS